MLLGPAEQLPAVIDWLEAHDDYGFDLARIGALTFREPDLARFPCLALAFEAMRRGDSAPAVLNAANEVAVERFLERRIGFDRIPEVVETVLERTAIRPLTCLEDVMAADREARETATNHTQSL